MQELEFTIVEMKFDPLNVVAIVIDLKIGGQNSLDCDDGHVCYEINSMFSYLEKSVGVFINTKMGCSLLT